MKGEGESVVDWLRGPSSWNGDREKGRAEGVNGEDCAHQECCDVSADFIRGRRAGGEEVRSVSGCSECRQLLCWSYK